MSSLTLSTRVSLLDLREDAIMDSFCFSSSSPFMSARSILISMPMSSSVTDSISSVSSSTVPSGLICGAGEDSSSSPTNGRLSWWTFSFMSLSMEGTSMPAAMKDSSISFFL